MMKNIDWEKVANYLRGDKGQWSTLKGIVRIFGAVASCVLLVIKNYDGVIGCIAATTAIVGYIDTVRDEL